MANLSKSDLDALAFVGLYKNNTAQETLDSYTKYIWTREDVCENLTITLSVLSRFYINDYQYDNETGVSRYCPLVVARYIKQLLKKRGKGETLREFSQHAIIQNRRSTNPKKYGGTTTRTGDRKTSAILEVILDLTRGKPNAYKAFDVALRKVGVFLPPPKE